MIFLIMFSEKGFSLCWNHKRKGGVKEEVRINQSVFDDVFLERKIFVMIKNAK
jgi:predicted Rdx family selenoprotein